MKKYSLIINYISDDKYAVVFTKWIEINGEKSNEETVIKTELSLEEALNEQNNFIG